MCVVSLPFSPGCVKLTTWQNVELFFCLYAQAWGDPEKCNSSNSRLLGFFSAVPAIWRALQCLRRYHDTRNVFPHLVNCGKYAMTIVTAVCLSLYRIDDRKIALSFYIAFAAINAVYCCKPPFPSLLAPSF